MTPDRQSQTALEVGEYLLGQWSRGRLADLGFSLSRGLSGLAVFIQALFQETDSATWDRLSRDFLKNAVGQLAGQEKVSPGAFGGLAGVLFACLFCASKTEQTGRLVSSLTAVLESGAYELLRELRISPRRSMNWQLFDLISGLCGIGIVTLSSPMSSAVVVHEIVETLNGLLLLDGNDPEAIFTPNELIDSKNLSRDYPDGMYNLGVAHGISGPLAFLSLAYMDGYLSFLPSAVEPICQWLVSHARFDSFGPWFPPGESPSQALRIPRATWCYGSPGVARSLWLGGQASGRNDIQAFAEKVIMASLTRGPLEISGMLCHGTGGLLQILKCMERDSRTSTFRQPIRTLMTLQIERATSLLHKELSISELGLLEGLSGIGCSLLKSRKSPSWDRIFAIA